MINLIHDIMVGVFEDLYITSKKDIELRINYTENIL